MLMEALVRNYSKEFRFRVENDSFNLFISDEVFVMPRTD